MAQMAANKLQMDVALWLYDFSINSVTAKDTILQTSFGNLL